MGRLTTHVLDTASGKPAAGLKIELFRQGETAPLKTIHTNADGRADRHEVILTGFGTQDSHLFPHQFLRQPGGQVFVAQGLFNYSTVRRPGGAPFADGSTEVVFDQCKLAAFALDGSSFENLTAGPNNIWGLPTSREGETFLQEANDFGYSLVPYAFGIHMRTGSRIVIHCFCVLPQAKGSLA